MGKNTAAVVEAPVTETPAEKPVAKRTQWRNESTVVLTEKGQSNPKKAGTMSFDRYEILIRECNAAKGSPVSVAALFKAGYRMDDVRHDSAHGFITLTQPFELGQ